MVEPTSALTPELVFIPSLRIDRGMGHLRRCLAAAASVGPQAVVYFAADSAFVGKHPVFERSIVQSLADSAGVQLWMKWPESYIAPKAVLDMQAAPLSAFSLLSRRTLHLIGWDDGGPARRRFAFLVDSLPHDTKPEPNVRLPGLLGLSFPPKPHRYDRPIRTMLAVFGGSDPAGLTLKFLAMVQTLRTQGRFPYSLTVVRGPLSRFIVPLDTEVLEAPPELPKLLGQWDLTVTSWGLTALESLAAGTPVLLLNPTNYHEQLSRAARLPTFGVRRPRADAFLSGLEDAQGAAREAFTKLLQEPLNAGEYFSTFRGTDSRCPVCRTGGNAVFFRSHHKSYHRCAVCGMEYLSAHQLPPKEYSEAYFFEDYQKQYGKTYLQDFAHIQALGQQRLEFLDRTAGTSVGRNILDVGCAYGPFLAAAAASGHHPFGLDVAEAAVAYVRDSLGFPAVKASFLEFRWEESFPGVTRPDLVSLWYVIEHFPDLSAVLSQVNKLLPLGGLFAFSTPNGKGITRTFQPEKFWEESPDDHFSIWNPANTKPILRRFGFEVLAFRVTGHHPERFPGLKGPSDPVLSIVTLLDRWLGWGDTFEVYARKTKELP